jgi:hypothetical protein
MARHINATDVTRTVKVMVGYMYITEAHKGVQIRTQWDTGIKSCQKAVQLNNIFHFISYWFYCFAYNKIKDIYYV